ncbi:MAG: hypothetical protein QM692_21165, partial [Thermomicrobiales bacterium]
AAGGDTATAAGMTTGTGAPPVAPVAPVVPAGSAAAVALDVERLPPVEKIRRALEAGARHPTG